MINLENLSCSEKKAIEELRKRIKNGLPNHEFEVTLLFYRFLKARDFNVDKAEDMLRKTLLWRKHFQVDTILEDFTPRPFFGKFIKLSHLGFDKKGNMVKYMPIGDLEGKEVAQCVQINEYMRHFVWHFEGIAADVRKLFEKETTEAPQITLIFNLNKLTLANATHKSSIDQVIRLLNLFQDNYPESLNATYVINAPAYYVFIFSIVKSMMSSALIQKFHIYSHNGWQDKLLEVIDADVLPAFLGGNRTDPDGNPLCTSFVTHGGRFPKIYHLPEEERDFKNKSLVQRITIPPKQKKEVSVNVTEIGSRIHWEFLVKSKDISFGLFYKASESELEEILPVYKYDTIDGVEKGSYKTKLCGNYVIIFDNSYSWLNSKEVEYCIIVLKSIS